MIEVTGVAEIILHEESNVRSLKRRAKTFQMEIIEKLPGYNHYRVRYRIQIKEIYYFRWLEDYYSIVKPRIEEKIPGVVTLIQQYSVERV